MVSELLADAPQRDGGTGLYDVDMDGKHPMKEFRLPLVSTAKEIPLEGKHNRIIMFR
jgi:phosphatidylserine decarboxylase